MDAAELARWTRFAAKGGIGKCTAIQDCVAERPDDLMFLKGDEIIVLMQIPDDDQVYLGFCEDIVGRFRGQDVHFHSKLKKPVMTKRTPSASAASASSSRTSSASASKSPSPIVTSSSFPSPPNGLPRDLSRMSMIAASPPPSSVQSPASPAFDQPPTSPAQVLSIPPSSPPAAPHSPSYVGTSPHAQDSPRRLRFPPRPLVVMNPDDSSSSQEPSPADGKSSLADLPPETSANTARRPSRAQSDELTPMEDPLRTARPGGRFDLDGSQTSENMSLDDQAITDSVKLAGSAHDVSGESDMSMASALAPRLDSMHTPQHDLTDAEVSGLSESGLRISTVPSVGDGAVGIGLTLLQNMIDDGASSEASGSIRERGSTMSTSSSTYSATDRTGDIDRRSDSRGEHNVSGPKDNESAPRSRAASVALSIVTSSSVRDLPSRASGSTHNSRARSDADDYWDGASIYDQYTYRHSVASKMSRFSQASMYAPSGISGGEAPPMPRPSASRQNSTDVLSNRSGISPSPSLSPNSNNFVDASTSLDTAGSNAVLGRKDRPAPLDLNPSPLLHTTFGSPMMSPGQDSGSPGLLSPSSINFGSGGAASALRTRLEGQRGPSPSTSIPQGDTLASPSEGSQYSEQERRDIVVEDDEQPVVLDDGAYSSVPPSPMVPGLPSPMNSSTGGSGTSESPPISALSPNFLPSFSTPPSPDDASPAAPAPYVGYSRNSIFLPHPSAPKPSPSPAGPMYGRLQGQPQLAPPALKEGSVHHAMGLARIPSFHPNGVPKQTTFYGKLDADMATATGPVPISFTLEPPMAIPALRMHTVAPPLPTDARGQARSDNQPSGQQSGAGADTAADPRGSQTPQPNFFPKPKAPRPRSQSFSGFDKPYAEIELLDGSRKSNSRPAVTPSVATPPTQSNGPISRSQSARPLNHGQSPLSLPQNNIVPSQTDPVPSNVNPPESSSWSSPRKLGLRQVASSIQLRGQQAPSLAAGPSMPRPPTNRSNSLNAPLQASEAAIAAQYPPSPTAPSSTSPSPAQAHFPSIAKSSTQPRSSISQRPSAEADPSDTRSVRSVLTPPPLLRGSNSSSSQGHSRESSLRSKLSMSALRSNTSGPVTPVDDKRFEIETVHVKDTDFQLIKPIPPVANSNSDDSLANSARDSKNDSRFLRTDSPSVSMLSGGTSVGTSSPLAEQFDAHPASPVVESPTAAEAHRQRELRWISLMTSTPAGQARKSKKVRKLLLEGVPASVRHLVWANLANSAGKRMDGLYAKLSQRGRVPASNDIERDVRRYFNNQPLLQDTNSPVTTLLQAYLTMVPDIRYNTGLCLITGHLLQQAPEEEAFWIFVSIMDTHLRSYFSPLNVQAEVDGSLLLKAIEANEPAIAKKLSDTGITAGTACRHWFCSLFVTTLPTSHVSRVWDIFLCEGMPFLFRVALAILSSCRRLLLDARSPERLTELLFQPPPDMLPPTPDALISLAHSMKLKDDDLMKTRQKLETQLKRQNQGRALRSTITTNGSAPPSISLPRA